MQAPSLPSLPKPLADIGLALFGLPLRLAPYSLQRPLLELVLNEIFRQQKAAGDLDVFRRRTLSVRFTDIDCHWRFGFEDNRLLALELGEASDVVISGELREFLLLISQSVDPDTLFFQRRLNVEGDTELGLFVKNLLDGMDWSNIPEPVLHALAALAAGTISVRSPSRA